jgi:hypothetical protein
MPDQLVFISHGGEDTWIAKQIARGISERGGQPFLDQADIAIGANFEDEIRRFLGVAHELVVLFTPWSIDRPYVWMEIGAAWIRELPVVVILLGLTPDDLRRMPKMPAYLEKRAMIQLNDVEGYLDQVGKRVAGGHENV